MRQIFGQPSRAHHCEGGIKVIPEIKWPKPLSEIPIGGINIIAECLELLDLLVLKEYPRQHLGTWRGPNVEENRRPSRQSKQNLISMDFS